VNLFSLTTPGAWGAAFTRACHVLDFIDLKFHDLRHEATSRLFERGYQIHEVSQFTLHESWNELKRYTNLRPENTREIEAKRGKTALGESTIPPGIQRLPYQSPHPVLSRCRSISSARSATLTSHGDFCPPSLKSSIGEQLTRSAASRLRVA
jgi:hypothetical protein